jgi:hypothetical protein
MDTTRFTTLGVMDTAMEMAGVVAIIGITISITMVTTSLATGH